MREDAMAPKPQGQSGSEYNKPENFIDDSREFKRNQPTQPAEALPDALLTLEDVAAILHAERVTHCHFLCSDIADALNALLAPRVAARVVAALWDAAVAAETVVSAGLSVLSKAEQRAYIGGRTDAAHRVRKLISAPAQAALDAHDAVIAEAEHTKGEMYMLKCIRASLREYPNGGMDVEIAATLDKLLAEHTEPLLKRIAELEKLLNPPHVSQVQTSGPQCKKCGAFTTKKRVNAHGLCMKCENEVALASHTKPANKKENHD